LSCSSKTEVSSARAIWPGASNRERTTWPWATSGQDRPLRVTAPPIQAQTPNHETWAEALQPARDRFALQKRRFVRRERRSLPRVCAGCPDSEAARFSRQTSVIPTERKRLALLNPGPLWPLYDAGCRRKRDQAQAICSRRAAAEAQRLNFIQKYRTPAAMSRCPERLRLPTAARPPPPPRSLGKRTFEAACQFA